MKRVTRERKVPGRVANLPDHRFMVYKLFVDASSQRGFGHKRDLTLSQCRDLDRFPPGKHLDESSGRLYVWTNGLMPEYL